MWSIIFNHLCYDYGVTLSLILTLKNLFTCLDFFLTYASLCLQYVSWLIPATIPLLQYPEAALDLSSTNHLGQSQSRQQSRMNYLRFTGVQHPGLDPDSTPAQLSSLKKGEWPLHAPSGPTHCFPQSPVKGGACVRSAVFFHFLNCSRRPLSAVKEFSTPVN